MNIDIIHADFNLTIYGFSGIAINKDYVETAFRLSGKMWQIVKDHDLKNKGKNIWVYEDDHKVFAGVELNETFQDNKLLEEKNIALKKYAYYKHIGSYNNIKYAGQNMIQELTSKGYEITDPYIEIYGHWNNDETKLETELIMTLK